jgi:polar amino acid transport system substrate-binding protein
MAIGVELPPPRGPYIVQRPSRGRVEEPTLETVTMNSARKINSLILSLLGLGLAMIAGCGVGQAAQVKIATEGTYKPFSFYTAGGELTGFDVELTLAVCKAAGLDCVMVPMDNDAVLPALADRKIDAIATGMSVTEKRKKKVAFTDHMRSTARQFVSCTPDKFADVSPAALKGHVIGTQTGTTIADYFQALYAGSDVRLYKTMDDAFRDLAAGRVELVLSVMAVGYDFANSPAGAGCKLVGPRLEDKKYFGDGVAVAVRLDDLALRDAFNAGLRKVLADGIYKAINDKYFPFSLY